MTQPISNRPAVHGSSKGDQLHFSTSATSPTWSLQSLQPLQPLQLTTFFIPSLLPRPVCLIHTWGYFPAFSHFGTKGSRFGWLVQEYDQIGNEYEIRSCLIWLIWFFEMCSDWLKNDIWFFSFLGRANLPRGGIIGCNFQQICSNFHKFARTIFAKLGKFAWVNLPRGGIIWWANCR